VKGIGENTDIVVSSIDAFLNGCNKLRYMENYFANTTGI